MINDSSLKKVCKYKKFKDIYDISSLECNFALVGALLTCVFVYYVYKNSSIDGFNNLLITLTKDIAISLIGFLGFTVAGLAILTGVISQKIIKKVSESNRRESLEKILLSFYLLGVVIAIVIVILFWIYIFISGDFPFNVFIMLSVCFLCAYAVIFILFYAVKLIGNCLEIFFIVNDTTVDAKEYRVGLKEIYNSYRITALEVVCLKKMQKEDIEKYKKVIHEQINTNGIFVKELEEMLDKHFKKSDEKEEN